MKSILLLTSIFFILSFTISINNSEEIKQIKYGTDFCSGKCDGYCNKEKIYNSKYLITKESYCRGKQIGKIDTIQMSSSRWTNICKYVDINKFFKLPTITGSGGASDGGVEWVEIVTTKKTHKIKFDYNDNIKEIGALLVILRNRK